MRQRYKRHFESLTSSRQLLESAFAKSLLPNVLLLFLVFWSSTGFSQNQITWSDQIGCLIYSHCTPCHNDKGIAPFSLESYEEAFEKRFLMESYIARRLMPPWPPSDYSGIAHDRSLSEQEIELFKRWVEEGAPQGGTETLQPPVITSNLEITDPDFSHRLEPFVVPDLRELDLYRCFVIPTNESEDRYITGVEIIPGNRSIVHHVLLFQDTTNIPIELDLADPEPGYTCFGGVGVNSASMIGGWVPGSSASFAPEGMGIFLPKGANLVVQLHYPEGSAGQVDSTLINLKFSASDDVRSILNLPALNHFMGMDRPLFIPANTRQTFKQTFSPVPLKVTVTGIAPHAHLICESMKAYATTLQGDTIPLIDIPHWDFEWQGFYQFKEPVIIPFGSTLHGEATYNNTVSNPHLPGDIPQDVSVGEATTDEMMIFFLSLSVYQSGDENMIIDTTSHKVHLDDCSTALNLSTDISEHEGPRFVLGPNPSHGHIYLDLMTDNVTRIEFFDVMGTPIWSTEVHPGMNSVALPTTFGPGVYFYSLADRDKYVGERKKLILIR